MFKTAQTFLFSILFFIFSFFIFNSQAFAQIVNPPQDLHNYTQRVMIEVMSSMTCLLAGVDAINPSQKCLGVENGKIGPVATKGGAIGAVGSLIAMTFTPPAHGDEFVRYLARNFGISKPAYAQANGAGFQGISPLLTLWTAFRNISFLLFTLIFLVIGFAIMLRVHIDPRTVMTIENQIPKIVIGLILVTFSFAIAGFLIDLMYVFVYLVIGIFNTIGNGVPIFDQTKIQIWGYNPIEVANQLPVAGKQFSGGILGIANNAAGAVSDILISLFSDLAGIPLIGSALGGIVGILAFLIIAIAILFAMFRLWFTLLSAYVFIILDIVFAPFWVVAGMIPGSSISFTVWLKEISAELLAFPATIVMFLLANVFLSNIGDKGQLLHLNDIGNNQEIFHPPLIGNPSSSAFSSLIGLGILLMTPSVVSMIKGALKVPKFDMSAIGQAVGAGTGVLTGATKETAGSAFVALKGGLPKPDEGPMGSILRRFLR